MTKFIPGHRKIVEQAGGKYEGSNFISSGQERVWFSCPTTGSTFILKPSQLTVTNIRKRIKGQFESDKEYLQIRRQEMSEWSTYKIGEHIGGLVYCPLEIAIQIIN